MSEVDSGELNKLQGAMDRLSGSSLTKFKNRLTSFVAMAIKRVIQVYPGPSHSPVIWPSEKAKRWYFANRRAEKLPLEYTRVSDPWSQQLGRNWRIQRGQGETTLGNPSDYAPWAASDEFQTAQHKATGWVTDKQAVEKVVQDGTLDRIIAAQIKAMVKDAFKGV